MGYLSVLGSSLYWAISDMLSIFELLYLCKYSFNSFVPSVDFYSTSSSLLLEVLPAQHGYCVRVSRRSATGNCKWRTCPRYL